MTLFYYVYSSHIIDGTAHIFICKADILFQSKKTFVCKSLVQFLCTVNGITNTIVTSDVHTDHQGMTANWITVEIWSLGEINCHGGYFFGFKGLTCHML